MMRICVTMITGKPRLDVLYIGQPSTLGYVAQGIEQPPSKRSVAGSNPAVPVTL